MSKRVRYRFIPAVWGLAFVLVLAVAGRSSAGTLPLGASARYHVLGPGERSQRLVTDLRVTMLGRVTHDDRPFVDWQMDVTLKDGRRIAVRAASERMPMTSARGCGEIVRYRLRLPNGDRFDYRHQHTGRAVLPPAAFRTLFLPTPEDEPVLIDGFAAAGRFLGHIIIFDRLTRDFTIEPIEDAAILYLRPDLLVGTSRNVKDDGKGRPTPTANYNYVPLEEGDYDELIAAGTNYFGVDDKQAAWIRHRPVFYRGSASFPEDFYRSNYVPGPMFSDEPMVRLGWQGVTPVELDHPQQMASFLMSRVRHIYDGDGINPLKLMDRELAAYGIHLSEADGAGTGSLAPTWETEYQAAFYELAGGAPGIVHEGRYIEEGYGWHPTALFGPGLEVSTREMLLCYHAFLRGAARAFDGDWGTSIYGQSDPEMRLEALTLAYDMGAKYLWFWTSDHGHHMEFPDQLALTRGLMDHAAAHPRGDMADLRRAAKVGIAFPAGYTLSWGHMWDQRPFSFESRNRTGTPYREVVAAAMWEGVLCAKRGIPFDFTVEHAGLDALGYEQLLMIGEDAGVNSVPNALRTEPTVPSLKIEAAEPVEMDKELDLPEDVFTALPAYGRTIRIDGSLDEWQEASWFVHAEKPSGGGSWDGPRDLSTRVAFAFDESMFYIAAVIRDDRQYQPFYGWELWKGDSIQVGFDPLNENNRLGYSGNQHEIGLALAEGNRPVAWRWHCRRGQRPREMPGVRVAVERSNPDGETVYEAAVPLAELSPLAPVVTPLVGVAITVNDADRELRETYHETSPGAMVGAKNPADFRKLHMPPASGVQRDRVAGPRAWATIFWQQTVAPAGGPFSFECAARAWDEGELTIEAQLDPLPPLTGLPATASVRFPCRDVYQRRTVTVAADTGSGRYRLTATVKDKAGAVLTREEMTVFVYPK